MSHITTRTYPCYQPQGATRTNPMQQPLGKLQKYQKYSETSLHHKICLSCRMISFVVQDMHSVQLSTDGQTFTNKNICVIRAISVSVSILLQLTARIRPNFVKVAQTSLQAIQYLILHPQPVSICASNPHLTRAPKTAHFANHAYRHLNI